MKKPQYEYCFQEEVLDIIYLSDDNNAFIAQLIIVRIFQYLLIFVSTNGK